MCPHSAGHIKRCYFFFSCKVDFQCMLKQWQGPCQETNNSTWNGKSVGTFKTFMLMMNANHQKLLLHFCEVPKQLSLNDCTCNVNVNYNCCNAYSLSLSLSIYLSLSLSMSCVMYQLLSESVDYSNMKSIMDLL